MKIPANICSIGKAKYEDKLYFVRIIGCSVFPQGYADVVPCLKDMTVLNMLADIGNGTVNIMKISNRKPITMDHN